MGVEVKWVGAFPKLSRNVLFCPLLCPDLSPIRAPKTTKKRDTNGDKLKEDKRVTINVKIGLVFSFLNFISKKKRP